MLVGPSGVGKTTFGLQFLAGCTAAEPGLLFGFYETPARLRAKALKICRPLSALIDDGVVEILWEPSITNSLDAYADRMLKAINQRGVRRLFLDGLGAFHSAPSGDERMRQYLPALTNELRALGVTTIYSLEAGNVVGPAMPIQVGDLSILAENQVLLRYVETGGKLHRLISILKVRDSDFDPRAHEFVLADCGPQIMTSTQSAETLMTGNPPREVKLGPSPTPPRVG
jgi:circadian clock protein KaiC